jgi:hypothetical protein
MTGKWASDLKPETTGIKGRSKCGALHRIHLEQAENVDHGMTPRKN